MLASVSRNAVWLRVAGAIDGAGVPFEEVKEKNEVLEPFYVLAIMCKPQPTGIH